MKKGKLEEIINDINFEIKKEYSVYKTSKKISHLFVILGFILTYILTMILIFVKIVVIAFYNILYHFYDEERRLKEIYKENYAAGKGQADALNE